MKYAFLALLSLVMVACTAPSFYQETYNYNKTISSGNFDDAEKIIQDHAEELEESKIRFLYFVNGGLVEHLKGDFKKSNEYFEKADLFIEDLRKDALAEGAGLLLNPKLTPYYGEDHEVLLINYYKALNYYMLGENDEALVEARRLNLRLQTLSEMYKGDNKYDQDAFMHVLMGLIYEVNGEYNDAFIAYRNGYDIYNSDYLHMFGQGPPEQLKKDLLRTAAMSGMGAELRQYEKEFGMKYEPPTEEASLVMLWHNGMGPVKEEWGINFAIISNGGGWVQFVNDEYGFSFPFYIGDNNLNGLTWIKVVFPKYVERQPVYSSAAVELDGKEYALELAEDINAISFKVLDERMHLEFSKSLLRVALKQAAAYQIGEASDSPALGAALSVVASASESADTRNWQTIPRTISYVRVPIPKGDTKVNMVMRGKGVSDDTHVIEVDAKKGQTIIYPFYSMAAHEPQLSTP